MRKRRGFSLFAVALAAIGVLAAFSDEGVVREGVPIEHIEAIMNRAIDRGMQGRDIEKMPRAVSYDADKDTDYSKLGQFIEKKMNEGETGDDLALSIYKGDRPTTCGGTNGGTDQEIVVGSVLWQIEDHGGRTPHKMGVSATQMARI